MSLKYLENNASNPIEQTRRYYSDLTYRLHEEGKHSKVYSDLKYNSKIKMNAKINHMKNLAW